MPAKKAPSANDTPNSSAAPKATPSAIASTARREQLARAGVRDVLQQPRDDAAADHQHQRDEQPRPCPGCRAAIRRRRRRGPTPSAPSPPSSAASAGSSTSASTIARSSTISQPTAMRPRSVSRHAALLERAQQHDGAGDREREAEDEAARRATSPSSWRRAAPSSGGDARSGRSRPARRCARTASRSSSEKCRPTPNISRMTPISASCGGQVRVGDEARRERPDHDAGEQIADQRRQPQPGGERSRTRRRAPGRRRSWRSGCLRAACAARRAPRPGASSSASSGARPARRLDRSAASPADDPGQLIHGAGEILVHHHVVEVPASGTYPRLRPRGAVR